MTLTRKRNSWSRLPISYRGAIVIAIPAICLLATLGAWIWSRQSGLAVLGQIDRTEQTIAQSNQLLITLLNAETGVRGYHISREKEFLEPYQQAQANLPTTLDTLEQLLQDNTPQLQKLQTIEQLINQEMEVLTRTIKQVNLESQGIYSSEAKILIAEGKVVMDSLRQAIATLQTEEQALLNDQQEYLTNVRKLTTSIQWLTALFSALAYWAAVYLFNRLDFELHERERQLWESKTFIEAITSNVVDGVITLTKSATFSPLRQNPIETFNPAAAQMFGYEAFEVIGQDLTRLLIDPQSQGEDKLKKIQFLQTNLQQESSRWQTLGYRKDGTDFPIEISVSDMEPDDRLMVIIRDVTENEASKAKLKARAYELAHLSAMLAKTNVDLEKQNKELDKFAYVASHDLKAPLRAIASLTEWLEEDLDDKLEEGTRYQMRLLKGRVKRLENLINGLLEYSRIGRVKTAIETVDVNELLKEIIQFSAIPNSFTVEIASKMPIFKTKKLLLKQVFSNLISNAIKHHDRSEGTVRISAKDLGQDYEFAVADDGPGIPVEYYERIFFIFQTLYPRDIKENTGIGLAIVQRILETEGGVVWLAPQPERGVTFYFTWPK